MVTDNCLISAFTRETFSPLRDHYLYFFLTRTRMEAIIRCEDLLSDFAEIEKKSQPIHWITKESQRIHLGYPPTG